ncbi:MAG: hypothetical protein HY066_15390 [Betaproteobacteria bacterium]|nr:hypothetical protein [Betaproteobacteria bacterium]
MIAGAIQQQLRATTLTAISAIKGNGAGPSLPVSGTRAGITEASSVMVNVGTARTLADVAKKYAVRDMSPQEMAAMSQELYQSGAITFQDHALLSFQPELSPQFDKTLLGAPGKPDAPKDFIAQWETQLQMHEKMGDVNFAKNDQRILNILGNLAALRVTAAPA